MNRRMYVVCVVLVLVVMITPCILAEEAAKTAAPASNTAASDPLVRVLLSKGVITAEEARYISSGNAADQREKLLYLLKDKGLLTKAELEQLNTPAPQPQAEYRAAVLTSSAPTQQTKPAEAPKTPPPPAVIPAVAPLRVLQLEPSKKDGVIPDLKLGSGARLKLYGFLKMSVVHDTSSPYGNDFPLPGFVGSIDTGPNTGSEFHIKARGSRVGTIFEWPDISNKVSITGKLEMDFEGNFTRVNNRNISTIRSSQPSIRLAYGRVDYKVNANTSWFALFGQDWTPFGSSTLPNLLETTGLGIGFGTLYERDPQVRVGMQHNFGGSRKFTIDPEFAIVLPASGLPPADISNQLGYGERLGPDSGRPQVQGRMVFQWQLDPAAGVAPAQIIVSAMNGERRIYVPSANIPLAAQSAFPHGADVTSKQNGVSLEAQFPTRFMTLIAKYYQGEDLRYYFANGLYTTYTDTLGFGATAVTGTGVDGSAVTFVDPGTGYIVAPQRPLRVAGGFVNVGFPLGRIFGANPASRAAGWQLYLHYGIDDPYSRDVRKTLSAAAAAASLGARDRSDLSAGTLYWKMNSLVTFGWEESYYHTKLSGPGTGTITGPIWNGGLARSWHDVRSEFSTIFTF